MTTDIRLEETRVVVEGQLYAADDVSVPLQVGASSPVTMEMIAVGKELSRLRAAVLELGMMASVRAEAPHYTQDGWRWCSRCASLHFAPNAVASVCPQDTRLPPPPPGAVSSAVLHSTANSGAYTLFPDRSRYPGQPNWLWCNKCQGLFNNDNRAGGVCAAGGHHRAEGSPNYVLCNNSAPAGVTAQGGWHYCNKCQLLFHGDNTGICPGGATHSATGSGNYFLAHR